MGARTTARRRSLEILYEADVRGLDPLELVVDRIADRPLAEADFAREIVDGVVGHRDEIDALLTEAAVGWDLARMPVIDRNLLRQAVWELLWGEVDAAIAIDEAVELAHRLSTDESPRFVNGVLSQVLRGRARYPGGDSGTPPGGP